ncbi:MAG: alkaline phosphatase family protein [Actinomycetes bacterium]
MRGLADVPASAAASLGIPGYVDSLDLGEARHVVMVLVDGLGWNSLQQHRELAPCLTSSLHESTEISTVFPSTTPAGLGTLGTALLPGAHGLVGASFWLPESEEILTPLHWNEGVTPLAVQPERTIFESAAMHGVEVTTVAPGAYADSGLTRAVLRGGSYQAADSMAARIEHTHRLVRSSTRSLTYVYWPDLDRIGHGSGVGSGRWNDGLAQVDRLIEQIAESLPSGALAVVTADHGMVNCDDRISIDDDPILREGVERIAGEPRMRHVYVREGAAAEATAAWRDRLAGKVDVRTREELIDSGLLGDVEFDFADRIGDLVAISRGTTSLTSSFDRRVSALIGQHGAMTDEEMRIPAIVMRGTGN